MRKWWIGYGFILALVLGIYLIAEYHRPRKIDWSPTLASRDRIPFGTYILYQSLDATLGLRPIEIREPPFNLFRRQKDTQAIYMLIAPALNTSKSDEEAMARFVRSGNTLFIATESLTRSLSDSLKIALKQDVFSGNAEEGSGLRLVNPSFGDSTTYATRPHTADAYFDKLDTGRALVLGRNRNGQVNFIRYPVGKGQLLLHSAPVAFTNHFLLGNGNSRYVSAALAYLPGNAKKLYWDEYYKIGRGGASTPLRVILTRPPLRAAYFTALAGILLFILFQTKRRQRAIPVSVPVRNDSMDFVETVSRVYFNQANHLHIARKKLHYLQDLIRTRYGLATSPMDEAFIQKLTRKSGYPEDKVQVLVSVMSQVEEMEGALNAAGLMQFSKLIEDFQKNTDR